MRAATRKWARRKKEFQRRKFISDKAALEYAMRFDPAKVQKYVFA